VKSMIEGRSGGYHDEDNSEDDFVLTCQGHEAVSNRDSSYALEDNFRGREGMEETGANREMTALGNQTRSGRRRPSPHWTKYDGDRH